MSISVQAISPGQNNKPHTARPCGLPAQWWQHITWLSTSWHKCYFWLLHFWDSSNCHLLLANALTSLVYWPDGLFKIIHSWLHTTRHPPKAVAPSVCYYVQQTEAGSQSCASGDRPTTRYANTQQALFNFQFAMWKAFPSIFPESSVKGCCFHCTQAT